MRVIEDIFLTLFLEDQGPSAESPEFIAPLTLF
jgi:hypothetical protein